MFLEIDHTRDNRLLNRPIGPSIGIGIAHRYLLVVPIGG